MTRMTLYPDQQVDLDRMVAEPTRACLNASTTGVGKTVMTIELIRGIDAKTVLIIAPPNTSRSWKATAEQQEIGLDFKVIDSKHPQHFTDLESRVPGIYFVSREYFLLSGTSLSSKPVVDKKTKEPQFNEDGTPKMTKGREIKHKWSKVKPDLLAYDEVQAVSNRWSRGISVLRSIKAGYKIGMSATPQGNKFMNLWTICQWLWPKEVNPETGELYVDNSQWRWAAQWAEFESDPWTSTGQRVVGEKVEGAFVNSLPCYVRIEREETPYEVRKCYVDLMPEQRRMYDQMEADALVWLGEHPLIADLPLTQRMRMRQITLGSVSVDLDGEVDFTPGCESSKIDALHKILDKHHPGEPVVVFLDSAKFAHEVARRVGGFAWVGGVSQKDRDAALAEFGKSLRVIVATIPAVAEGLDGLQRVCNVEVWLSQSLNNMLNIQARGRLNRTGQQAEKIYQYFLMARDTDDDGHFQRLLDNRISVSNQLRKGK